MRNIVLSLIGVVIIIAAIFIGKSIASNDKKTRKTSEKVIKTVFTDTVKNGTVQIIIPANGSLVAKRRVELYSEVSGVFKVGSKLFKPGQRYNKGEVLIRIDNSEHYANVQSAKSVFYNAIAAIMPDLRLDFPEIYPKWQTYLKNFNLEQSTPKLPEMSSQKENYFITGRGIVSNYYAVKNLEQRLSKYKITAPFSGVLTEALVTEGALVRNNQKLGEFINPSVFEMEVAIGKTYVSFLKIGESVALTNLDQTESYTGTVSRINGRINPETQTATAFIEVRDDRLKEGMYLEASIKAKNEENAIEVNRNLMVDDAQIFVVRDSILDVIDVKPVYFSDTKVILKNIPDGTVIVKKPIPGAYAGMQVKPFSSKPKSATKISKTENIN